MGMALRNKWMVTISYSVTHCNTLQHTATHCNTLQHTATHCNTLQHTATRITRTYGDYSIVQLRANLLGPIAGMHLEAFEWIRCEQVGAIDVTFLMSDSHDIQVASDNDPSAIWGGYGQ